MASAEASLTSWRGRVVMTRYSDTRGQRAGDRGTAMQVDLQGQVALVTGAAQGIGRAIADTLARNGAVVVYTDLEASRTDEIARAAGPEHLSFTLDVADAVQIEQVVAAVAKEAGRIDILINNAGIGVKAADRKTIDEFPVETWDEIRSEERV